MSEYNDQRIQEALLAYMNSHNPDEAFHILEEYKAYLLTTQAVAALQAAIRLAERNSLLQPLTIFNHKRKLRMLQDAIKHTIAGARRIEEQINERELAIMKAYLSIPLANERLLLLTKERKKGVLPTEKTISQAINDLRPIVKKHKDVLLNVKTITNLREWLDENPDQRPPEVMEAKQRFLEEAGEHGIDYAWKRYLDAGILEIRHMFRDMPRDMLDSW